MKKATIPKVANSSPVPIPSTMASGVSGAHGTRATLNAALALVFVIAHVAMITVAMTRTSRKKSVTDTGIRVQLTNYLVQNVLEHAFLVKI